MRRSVLLVALVGAATATQAGEPSKAPIKGVIDLGNRRELFVDGSLVERLQGAELKMHQPVPQDVAIVCDAPWEGNTSAYFTVFADGDRFRMYYRGSHF